MNKLETLQKFVKLHGDIYTIKEHDKMEVDFALQKGSNLNAFFEVRIAKVDLDQFPEVRMTKRDYERLDTFGFLLPTFYMINFNDNNIAWINVEDIDEEQLVDNNQFISIPISKFKTIKIE